MPGEFAEVDTAQLMFADGEGHELDLTGIYLLLYQYGVHMSVGIPSDRRYHCGLWSSCA